MYDGLRRIGQLGPWGMDRHSTVSARVGPHNSMKQNYNSCHHMGNQETGYNVLSHCHNQAVVSVIHVNHRD